MNLFVEKSQCYGCSACANACLANAISMCADAEGFLYPAIDANKCMDCGRCKEVCQIGNPLLLSEYVPKVYAVQHKDDAVREQSTSGGAFSALSDHVLQEGGSVYGAIFDKSFIVRHMRAISTQERNAMCGSKYSQSEISDAYRCVYEDLVNGRLVLFTGTPCQVMGLRCYLGDIDECAMLTTCEVVCHAVPSPLIFQEHITLLEKKHKSNLTHYSHRSKIRGWHGHNECAFFENGDVDYISKLSQNYKDLFYRHLIIRPCCYECHYAGFPRNADITIADFWGIETHMPDFDDNCGTSLVIINSIAGDKVFEHVQKNLHVRKSNINDAFSDNHKHPAKMNLLRDKFWTDYRLHGFEYVAGKYAGYTYKGCILYWIKNHVRMLAKRIGVYRLIHQITALKYQKATYQ